MVIPHTSIPISSIRTNDIQFLLVLGCVTELVRRAILRNLKVPKPESFQERDALAQLRIKTNQMRNLGPSAFVETSKLERKVLSLEKKLKEGDDARKKKATNVEKVLKRLNHLISLVLFLIYFGIPLLTIDGLRVPLVNPDLIAGLDSDGTADDAVDVLHATVFFKGIMFPLSYIGMGMKISKLGLGEIKHCSTGALVVFWSAQVFTGQIFDCYEALRFR